MSARARSVDWSASGVSMVELLVAVALMGLALGTVAMLATAVLAGFEADPAAADEQQRARSGINARIRARPLPKPPPAPRTTTASRDSI